MTSHTPFRPFLPAPDLLTWREMDERLEYDRGLSERVMGDTEARALLFAYEDGRTLAHWAAETSPAAALRAIRDPSIASLGAQSDWGSVAATAVHYHEAAALEALDNPAIYRLPAGHGGWVAHVALTYQEMARRKVLESPSLAAELDSRGRPLLFYAFSNHYEIAHRVCRSALLSAITDAEGNRMDEVARKRYPALAPLRAEETSLQTQDGKRTAAVEGSRGLLR